MLDLHAKRYLLLFEVLGVLCSASIAASGQSRYSYEGNIGGKRSDYGWTTGGSKIRIELVRDGDSVHGSYWYSKVGKDIPVSGFVSTNRLDLTAYPESSFVEHFELKAIAVDPDILHDYDIPTPVFQGFWVNGSKHLPTSIWQVPVQLPAVVKVRELQRRRKIAGADFQSNKPEIAGLRDSLAAHKIDLAIERIIADEEARFFKDATKGDFETVDFDLTLANNTLLSFVYETVQGCDACNHPSEVYSPLTFDLTTGRQLTLNDLFSDAKGALRVIELEDAKSSKKRWLKPASENIKWYLRENTFVVIHDDDSGLGTVANGSVTKIPYARLRKFMGPSSPLRSVN